MLALYGHPFSSYTWKALIALYANGTEFEFREIDQSVPKYESFTGMAHPSGQFPVLTDGDTVVVETSAIVEYLAVHYPGPAPLIPTDPAEAVVARMIDRVFDHYVMGNVQRVMATYFVNNADRLGVLYVIWFKQIWLPGNGWQPYTHGNGEPNSDHTNHVHLSVR